MQLKLDISQTELEAVARHLNDQAAGRRSQITDVAAKNDLLTRIIWCAILANANPTPAIAAVTARDRQNYRPRRPRLFHPKHLPGPGL